MLEASAESTDQTSARIDVSIIVPVYNVQAQLQQCLESLVQQTLPAIEIIILDDGSTDGSSDIAAFFASNYPGRVHLHRRTNGGCASARMAGLNLARGTFVGFVDGDDWVDPRMFEALFRETLGRAADIVQCGYQEVFADGTVVLPSDEAKLLPLQAQIVCNPSILAASRPTIWRRIYCRSFLSKHKIVFPTHIRSFDDTAFQFETFCRAKLVILIPQIYYFYRQDRDGQDLRAKDDRLFNFFPIFDWLESRVIASSDIQAEKQLLRVELTCHAWALSQIEPMLHARYKRKAIDHLGRRRLHLSRWQTLSVGWRMYRGAKSLLLQSLLARLLLVTRLKWRDV